MVLLVQVGYSEKHGSQLNLNICILIDFFYMFHPILDSSSTIKKNTVTSCSHYFVSSELDNYKVFK